MIRKMEIAQAPMAQTPPTIRARLWNLMPPSHRGTSLTARHWSVLLRETQIKGWARTFLILDAGITLGPAHSGWRARIAESWEGKAARRCFLFLCPIFFWTPADPDRQGAQPKQSYNKAKEKQRKKGKVAEARGALGGARWCRSCLERLDCCVYFGRFSPVHPWFNAWLYTKQLL